MAATAIVWIWAIVTSLVKTKAEEEEQILAEMSPTSTDEFETNNRKNSKIVCLSYQSICLTDRLPQDVRTSTLRESP